MLERLLLARWLLMVPGDTRGNQDVAQELSRREEEVLITA